MAGRTRGGTGPLSRLAQRNHAATDHRRRRGGVFLAFRRPLAHPPSARRGGARRGAARLAGAGLLCAGPQPAQMRAAAGRPTWRPLPRRRGGSPRAPRHRPLHRGGDRRHRLRPPGDAGGRQCRTRGRAAVRCRGAAAACEAGAPAARRRAHPGSAPGRLRPGDDGSGRHGLHAPVPALRAVPPGRLLRGAWRRDRRGPAAARNRARCARPATAPRSGPSGPTARCCSGGGPRAACSAG